MSVIFKSLDILGFPQYRVGTDGSVWSRYELVSSGRGGIKRIIGDNWTKLTPVKSKFGYCKVTLRDATGQKVRKIHTLVLEAFIGPCPKGMECRHLDGNRANNALYNICWGTKLENWADRKRHGTGVEGVKHPNAKLTDQDVKLMRQLRCDGWTLKQLVEIFPVSDSLVSAICTGKAWSHLKS
jgi:hypothetical protein